MATAREGAPTETTRAAGRGESGGVGGAVGSAAGPRAGGGGCGSRSTGGCRPRTGRTRVVAGAAAGAGRGAGPRARADCGGVLRRGAEPDGGVGPPPASRRAGRPAGRPGPGLGRDRGRGVRAGVLRQPVRADGAVVRALRGPAVDAGGWRPGRLRVRARRAGDDGAGAVVEAGGHPDQYPGADRDGRPGPGAGPLPRRPAAVRVPAG